MSTITKAWACESGNNEAPCKQNEIKKTQQLLKSQ